MDVFVLLLSKVIQKFWLDFKSWNKICLLYQPVFWSIKLYKKGFLVLNNFDNISAELILLTEALMTISFWLWQNGDTPTLLSWTEPYKLGNNYNVKNMLVIFLLQTCTIYCSTYIGDERIWVGVRIQGEQC